MVDWVALGEVELMSTSSTLAAMMHHVMMIAHWGGENFQRISVVWHKIVYRCV